MLPLLQSQRDVFLASSARPGSVAWNLPSVIAMGPAVDADRLEQALRRIISARGVLHVRLVDGRQVIDRTMAVPVVRRRMSSSLAVWRHAATTFVRPFALDGREPLCRFEIIETPAPTSINHQPSPHPSFRAAKPLPPSSINPQTSTFLLLDIHHLIADGHTLSRLLLQRDLPLAYAGEPLPPDDAEWMGTWAEQEQASFAGERYQQARAAMVGALRPSDFVSLGRDASDGDGQRVSSKGRVDASLVDGWCRRHGATPNELFLSAFALVLSRLSRQERVGVSVLHHGRTSGARRRAYGMFVRSVPVVVDFSRESRQSRQSRDSRDSRDSSPSIDSLPPAPLSVGGLLGAVRGSLAWAVRHGAYPFAHWCEEQGVTPGATFAFQSAAISERVELGGREVVVRQLRPRRVSDPLSCMVYADAAAYEWRLEASDARLTAAELRMLSRALGVVVESVLAGDASVPLSTIALTSAAEQQRLLTLGRGQAVPIDERVSVVELVLRQAALSPDAIAVDDGTRQLSYGDMAAAVERQAAELRARGVGRGQVVRVAPRRTCQLVVDVLAVLRASAAFCLEEKENLENLDSLDHLDHLDNLDHLENLDSLDNLENLSPAYLLFTSGTTGPRKAVVVSGRSLLHFVSFIASEWRLSANDRIMLHSSLTFDAAIEDLFPILTVGGRLVIVPSDVRMHLGDLARFIVDRGITGGCLTTRLGQLLVARYDPPLRYLCLGGERLTAIPPSRATIINTYGPTEFTVDATWHVVRPDRRYPHGDIPIGRPLHRQQAQVVDRQGQLVPRGAVGELWLSGSQLAMGLASPYPTGDLVRWGVGTDDNLYFVGREDRQLKLRGYRIEPAQVERALLALDGVEQAAVDVRTIRGRDHLCAWYVTDRSPSFVPAVSALSLPRWMVPSAWCRMEQLPLSASGKILLDQLPTPQLAAPRAAAVPAATPQERALCEAFAQVLSLDAVGATDDFFALGGTSLDAMHLLGLAADQGLHLRYGDVFSHRTPRALAEWLDSVGNDSPSAENDSPENIPAAEPIPQAEIIPAAECPAPRRVLLTGATGFLGVHLMARLLAPQEKLGSLENLDNLDYLDSLDHLDNLETLHCLVRARSEAHARQRLRRELSLHGLPTSLADHPALRLVVGDATDPATYAPLLHAAIQTVVHSAANVRHFDPTGHIAADNEGLARCALHFCEQTGARLVMVSTLSVEQPPMPALGPNDYLRSKRRAEQMVARAVAAGALRQPPLIVRVGSLLPSSAQGWSHPRWRATALAHLLHQLASQPQAVASLSAQLSASLSSQPSAQPLPLTPVHLVAAAIAALLSQPTTWGVVSLRHLPSLTVAEAVALAR